MRKPLTIRSLFNYFLGGLLITLPIAVTIWLVYEIIAYSDEHFPLESIIGFSIPGLSIILIIILITIIGYVAKGIITKPIIDFIDSLFEKIPGVKIIYSLLKDVMQATVGDKKVFKEPVAVEMSTGVFKLGFVTQKDMGDIGMEGYVAVYFPHSYNFSGNLFLVSAEKIKPIDSAPNLMKFIVSGGMAPLKETEHKSH